MKYMDSFFSDLRSNYDFDFGDFITIIFSIFPHTSNKEKQRNLKKNQTNKK